MAGRGHPTDYRVEFAELARNYCFLGSTQNDLGPFFDVSTKTISRWIKAHPEFAAAIKEGSVHANARVTGALYQKAIAGDVTAIIWWQKNKMGWRDRIDTIAKIGISPIDDLLAEVEGSTFKPKVE